MLSIHVKPNISPVKSCDELGFAHNVETFDPWQLSYDVGDRATMMCLPSYIISWATTSTEGDAVVECGSTDWIPEGQIDFAGTVGCVGKFLFMDQYF